MNTRRSFVPSAIALFALLSSPSTQADIVSFTSIDAFLDAVDDIQILDFATLPDGSPSIPGTPITPDFNYTDQGVTFSSPFPVLRIGFPSDAGLGLDVQNPDSGARNWLIADFAPPVSAVGVTFPGHSTLSIYGGNNQLLDSLSYGGGGFGFFLGFVSDTPIYRAIGDRGASFQTWDTMFYAPVPEPATFLLMTFGAVCLIGRRR
jgi:hypothetical protein